MFSFTIKYFGFLKFVPGVAHVFDAWLKLYTFATKGDIIDWMDNIRTEAAQWPGVEVSTHKYGGMQFNYGKKEIGHIHGNGLLDMLFSRKVKKQLMKEGRIRDHHYFKHAGWISFWIKTESDMDYALMLLRLRYEVLYQHEFHEHVLIATN